tara:strand:- start:129 stop:461 length:333 start_codon:yes stop_codon:yes gene_type:complete
MRAFNNNIKLTDANDYINKVRQRTLVQNIQTETNYSNNKYYHKKCDTNFCCNIIHSNSHKNLLDIKNGFNLVTNKNLITQNTYPYQNMCFHKSTSLNDLDPNGNTFPNKP